MKFELHKKVRWDGDQMSDRDYFGAVAKYYQYLSRLNFSGNKTLLRYFGDSFFHDGLIRKATCHRQSAALELQITTLNDLEHINSYRERKRLSRISQYRYLRNPVIYLCRFSGVTIGRKSLSRLRNRRCPIWIMDTEIQNIKGGKDLAVRISTGPDSEIEFTCQNCSVRIKDRRRIIHWTEGLTQRLPRCVSCRLRMLNPVKVRQVLRNAEARRRASA